MKNKKSYLKNRIKGFFLDKGRDGQSRIKEIDKKGEKDQHPENPEKEDDLS
jgi:hypothetical protein